MPTIQMKRVKPLIWRCYAFTIMKITNDTLIAAMFLFEKENGNQLDQSSIREIEKEGLATVRPSDVENSIKDFLEAAPNDDPLLGTAIFALGKRYDPN